MILKLNTPITLLRQGKANSNSAMASGPSIRNECNAIKQMQDLLVSCRGGLCHPGSFDKTKHKQRRNVAHRGDTECKQLVPSDGDGHRQAPQDSAKRRANGSDKGGRSL